MTTVFSNPNTARWGRRIIFALAAIGALLLARGDNLDGSHDYLGAIIIALLIIGIEVILEIWDRKKPAGNNASQADGSYWKCGHCSEMNPQFLASCARCGTARGTR